MITLVLDAALDGALAAVVRDGAVLAEARHDGARGGAAVLPELARRVLAGRAPDRVRVTVGPGSFTGVRAALAVAHGIGAGASVPVEGVTVGAAIRAEAAQETLVWVAIDTKRDRVFLDDGASVRACFIEDLVPPAVPVAVAGNAAAAVAARLGAGSRLLPIVAPGAVGIDAAPSCPALPLYVDPPEARPPR